MDFGLRGGSSLQAGFFTLSAEFVGCFEANRQGSSKTQYFTFLLVQQFHIVILFSDTNSYRGDTMATEWRMKGQYLKKVNDAMGV